MGQYCFAGWRLSGSVTLLTGGPAAGSVGIGSWAADAAQRASMVTSR